MQRDLSSMLLCGAMMAAISAVSMTAVPLAAQTAPAPGSGTLEVSVTYGAMLSNAITSQSFWMQGGSVEVDGLFYHGLSAVADVGGMHTGNINASGVSLDMVTSVFGPRYTWAPAKRKYEFFGQGLLGVANGFDGLFPAANGAADSATSMALEVGGGMNVRFSRRVALRAIEANWLRTQFPNSATNVQNNLRLGAGVVFRFR